MITEDEWIQGIAVITDIALVWHEEYGRVVSAKMREKEIKGWRREKKLKLILAENPDWADLSLEWQENPGWKRVPEARPKLQRKVRPK